MEILSTILIIIAAIAVIFVLLAVGRKYVFSRFKVNKWIILSVAIILFILQALLGVGKNIYVQFIFMIPIIWFFLWFMEINSGLAIKSKEKKIVIKSKAKPNRAKHLNKDNK